ncbi:MAG: DNA polymerase I [Schleiferiaceae bacterium]|nr:DNA polymerase I [Schleiferiaceae bacterium]MDR9443090.1 DNA polymerase I [Schleiferiaceae bacterium]
MAESRSKLFLLDAYALIYRSYFAFIKNPRVTSQGLDTSAIFGFTNTLLEVLEKHAPTHIAIVYDTDKPTFRHEEFSEYKAQRDETPEAIKISVPYIRRLADAFNIPFIGVDGYEADDVIGTLAKRAEQENFDVYMMTPDKDFGQLVSEHIFMYRPGRMGNAAETWGIAEVKKRFDIEKVDQVVDYLGMMGDSVDNIPGIPGVGAKTASKLLKQYGSMEEMYQQAEDIKGKLGEKIRDHQEQALLSKHLARIITEVPVDFDPKELTKDPVNEEKVKELFQELEFRNMLKRVTGDKIDQPVAAAAPPQGGQTDLFQTETESATAAEAPGGSGLKTLAEVDHLYQLVQHPRERKLLLEYLLDQEEVCFDTETTALDTAQAELVGIAFSYAPHKAYYLHLPEGQEKEVLEEFRPFFENAEIRKIGQNIKYDLAVLYQYGMAVKGPLWDTMLAHYVLEPDQRHNLDVLAETYLRYQPQPISELIGKKGKKQLNMRQVSPECIAEYAGEDADLTYKLKLVLDEKLEGKLREVFENIEMPLVPVLAHMESEGINLDVEALRQLSKTLTEDIQNLDTEIHQLAGGIDFNIASPRQLGEVLFDKLQLKKKPKKTKSGQYATSEDVMLELAAEHDIAQKVLDYRQLQKLKNTYVDALPDLINPRTQRVHTSFNQAVAATGRLSSQNPNLQNIPIRTERGRLVRQAFIPRDAQHRILAADYSQIELRLIAELSGEENMMTAFREGADIHAATAAKVFQVKPEAVTREQRSNAKTVNFGIIYGVSAYGLSQQTSLSRGEAAEIIKSYFQSYPAISRYIEEQKEIARRQGYVETITGRRRYLRDINSRNPTVRGHAERNAVNAPIQGSAADIIKRAMIQIVPLLRDTRTRMLLQVHDELVFDAHRTEIEDLSPRIQEIMQNAATTQVPLEVEVGTGGNWLEAH